MPTKDENNKITPTVSDRRTIMGNRGKIKEQQDMEFLRGALKKQESELKELISLLKDEKTEKGQTNILKDISRDIRLMLNFLSDISKTNNKRTQADAKMFMNLEDQLDILIDSFQGNAVKVEKFADKVDRYAREQKSSKEDLEDLFVKNVDKIAKGEDKDKKKDMSIKGAYNKSELARGIIEVALQSTLGPILAAVKTTSDWKDFTQELRSHRVGRPPEAEKVTTFEKGYEKIKGKVREKLTGGQAPLVKTDKELIEQERQQEQAVELDRENAERITAEVRDSGDRIVEALGGEGKKGKDKSLFSGLGLQLTALGKATDVAISGLSTIGKATTSVATSIGSMGTGLLAKLGGGSAMTGAGIAGGVVIAAEVAYLGKIAYDTHKVKKQTAKVEKETYERKKKLISIKLAKRHGMDAGYIGELLEKTNFNVAAVDEILKNKGQAEKQIEYAESLPSKEADVMTRVEAGGIQAIGIKEIDREMKQRKLKGGKQPVREVGVNVYEKEKPYYEVSKTTKEVAKPYTEVSKGYKEVEKPYYEVASPVHEVEKPYYEVDQKPKQIIERGGKLTPQQKALMGKTKREAREVSIPVTTVPSETQQLTPQQERLMKGIRGKEVPAPVKQVQEPTIGATPQEILLNEGQGKVGDISEAQRRLMDARTRRKGVQVGSPVQAKGEEVSRVPSPRVEDTTVREQTMLLREIKEGIENQPAPVIVSPEQYQPSPSVQQMPNHVDDIGIVLMNNI